jgi:hypothetical protein
MADPEENQRHAEQDAAAAEILREVLSPGRSSEPRPGRWRTLSRRSLGGDPFLFPCVLFMAGLWYLLHLGDWGPESQDSNIPPGFWGLLGFFIFVTRLAVAVAIALVLRRILALAHGVDPRLAWGVFGCVMLVLAGTAGTLTYLKDAKARASEVASAEVHEAQRRSAEQSLEVEARSAQAERDARTALVARWRFARTQAHDAWRKKMVAAGMLGGRAVLPPMLEVRDDGKTVTVTNRATDSACVLVTRIGVSETGATERCTVGATRCVLIPRGETRRLATYLAGNPESCLAGPLEFRVGNVDFPEPSWWSASAYEAFGERADEEHVERWSDDRLLSEASRLEKQAP